MSFEQSSTVSSRLIAQWREWDVALMRQREWIQQRECHLHRRVRRWQNTTVVVATLMVLSVIRGWGLW